MRQTRKTGVPTLVLSFTPALLLSLVLGAALRLMFVSGSIPLPSGIAAPPVLAFGAPHATEAIAIPANEMSAGPMNHQMASPLPVAAQLAARAEDVEFCVGSTLEPFDPAWDQLLTLGPDEAAERTRRCLMELVFTHVDPATVANVRAQLPAFSACYQRAASLPAPRKKEAMAEVVGCLTTLAEPSN